jgi:NAD(P)-dependent dehydrogenase (short-subunit alcohol dehydrogenase family)
MIESTKTISSHDGGRGKRWLITGASSGFGRMLAERAAADGDRVIAVARRADRLAELTELPGVTALALDVTRPDASDEIVRALAGIGGELDVLVNNAGYGVFGSAEETPDATVRAVMETNYFAALGVARAALPALREARGRIVQLSSVLGQAVWPSSGAYSASKAAAEAAFEAMAVEVAPFGVRVVIVQPGVYATEFGVSADTVPHGPLYEPTVGAFRAQFAASDFTPGDPEEVVDAIRALVGAEEPPLRFAIGAEVGQIRAALQSRLADLERTHPAEAAA